jgi:hypothetical protein
MLYFHWTILDSVTISVTSIPKELELKDTTDLLGLPRILTYYSKWLITKLYDKHDDVLFRIINFPLVCGYALHPLLKASPQKFYGRHTESVDKYSVSISTGAPGSCSRFGGVRVAHLLLVLCVFSFISYVLLVVFVSVFIASSLSHKQK